MGPKTETDCIECQKAEARSGRPLTYTTASTEPDYFRQALAANFAYGYITSMLDRDPDAATMRRNLRHVLAELRSAGIGETR